MMKIFKKVAKLLIFGIFALNPAQAQTFPWGSYQQPLPDSSSFEVNISTGVYLSVNAVDYDSIVWQTNLGNFTGYSVRATTDLLGKVLVKKSNKWTYKQFNYNGITRNNLDSLIAPFIFDGRYTWTLDGNVLPSNFQTNPITAPGLYTVVIDGPAVNGEYRFTYNVEKAAVAGLTISSALPDQSVLASQHYHVFSVNPADSILWSFNTEKVFNKTSFPVLYDGAGYVYVKRNNTWKYANISFTGINVEGTTLKSNAAPGVSYQWYKNGTLIADAVNTTFAYSGPGTYKLEATWAGSSAVPAGSGIYSKYVSLIINPTEVNILIDRSGNTFSINSVYSPDSVIWNYYSTTLGVAGPILNSKGPSLTLDYDAVIRAYVYQDANIYTQKQTYYRTYNGSVKGSFRNPIDSMFVIKTGTELAFFQSLNTDSIQWTLIDSTTNTASYSTERYVNLYKDTDVSVLVKSKGKWLKQVINFKGILYDSASFELQAPVIQDALYIWYFNGQPTGVTASSYTPTEPGTYKVLITWIETAGTIQNSRIEAETKTATYTFVVTPGLLTGLNESTDLNGAALQLYPNPAVDFVSVTNVNGSFAYSICSVNGNEVAGGQSLANSNIDISNLETGVYMMNIKTQFSQVTKRIIVK